MKKILQLIIAIIGIGIVSCQEALVGESEPNTILNTYDYFTEEFKTRYGLFAVKSFDWDDVSEYHRMTLEENQSEEVLYEVLTALVDTLDDSHVSLSHPIGQFPTYEGGIYGKLERAGYKDFELDIILNEYLNIIDSVQETVYYGTLNDNIGYVYLDWISDEPGFYDDYMPEVLAAFENTKGLIIDIRNNSGGEDEGGRALAGFFTQQRVHYMQSQYKIGPGENEFEPVRNWYVDPQSHYYDQPVILLTNQYSVSAAETFTLAMRQFDHVTHMGTTTTGAFSDAISRELPNGWTFSLSVGDYRDHLGFSHESIGLIPEIEIANSVEDLTANRDIVIEAAMNRLQ